MMKITKAVGTLQNLKVHKVQIKGFLQRWCLAVKFKAISPTCLEGFHTYFLGISKK